MLDRTFTSDRILTPDWCARDMVEHFKPVGRILEPCKGEGAFLRYLPFGTEWCEITEGRDFFAWSDPVDWIITNPPYSVMSEFLHHALRVADNVVFLAPARFVFSGYRIVCAPRGWGGMVALRWYGGGARLKFPMGNPVAAFHWRRGHHGTITETFFD